MSAFGKQGARCDTCGKFSRNRQGEYVRKDGSAGYIWPREGDDSKDDCEDCLERVNADFDYASTPHPRAYWDDGELQPPE